MTWRAEFPILARKVYLNSCSLGALSSRAEQRILQFHEEWHSYGASAWYETWLGRIDELRGRVAGMLNAGKADVKILGDGWTTVTRDQSLSAQFEHSVGVTEIGVEVFTLSPKDIYWKLAA